MNVPAACTYVPAGGRNERMALATVRAAVALPHAAPGMLEPLGRDPTGPDRYRDGQGGRWIGLARIQRGADMISGETRVTEGDFAGFLADGREAGPFAWVRETLRFGSPLRPRRIRRLVGHLAYEPMATDEAAASELDRARSIHVDGRARAPGIAVRHVEGEYLVHDGTMLARDRRHAIMFLNAQGGRHAILSNAIAVSDHGRVAVPGRVGTDSVRWAEAARPRDRQSDLGHWQHHGDDDGVMDGIVDAVLVGAPDRLRIAAWRLGLPSARGGDHPLVGGSRLRDLSVESALGGCSVGDPFAALSHLCATAVELADAARSLGRPAGHLDALACTIGDDCMPHLHAIADRAMADPDAAALAALGGQP